MSQLERVKALLKTQKDPRQKTQAARARKNAAIAKYVQANSVADKAAAAVAFLADDASKAQALKAALQSASNDAAKEQVIKQHLGWDEATKAAGELTQRHPEFTELKEVLGFFPPLVHYIGEPSVAQYKYKVQTCVLHCYEVLTYLQYTTAHH